MWQGWIWLILLIPVIACNLGPDTPSGLQEVQKALSGILATCRFSTTKMGEY